MTTFVLKDVLTDALPDARRYFKQSEIVLFRQAPEGQPQLALDKPSIGGKDPVMTPMAPA